MTITEATEEVTQAKEKLFIHGMPVTYTPPDGLPKQANYDEGFRFIYSDKHTITLLVDGTSVVVNGSDITPNRSLTDEEMVAHLTEQMFEMGTVIDRQVKTVDTLNSDIDKISTALQQEAENRGWCGEYNTFCAEVNSTLEMSELLPIEEEYNVSGKLTATASIGDTEVTIECSFNVTVTATSQEHADSMVEDDPILYFDPQFEAITAINSGFDSYDVEFN
jgi:hypothetical protein